jgi:hypothetical protein
VSSDPFGEKVHRYALRHDGERVVGIRALLDPVQRFRNDRSAYAIRADRARSLDRLLARGDHERSCHE